MTGFILAGLVMTVTIGAFVGLIFTSGVEFSLKKWVAIVLIALTVGYGIAGLLVLETAMDEDKWNDGHCECGGEWDLINVNYVKKRGNIYYYECVKCNNVIDTETHFH